MEIKELQFGHRRVCLYRLVDGQAPLVYSIDYHENGQLLLEACSQVDCGGFNLVTISGLRWNQELSPWPVETVVSRDDNFAGEAPQWLPVLTGEVVPAVERLLDTPPEWRMLAGYSLAGLFAVWTAFQCDLFSRILSASGSMWYPGWLEYARQHELAVPLQGIYLSVGDKESTSRNAVLQTVGGRTQALAHLMAERGIPARFELNPGNHFKNPPLRVAKGIKWLLHNGND
jgi:predicted alpha/beta superfamily hydrolase